MRPFFALFKLCGVRPVSQFAISLLLALGVSILVLSSANARDIFDPADPAFNGSVTVSLPPTPIPAGASSFQFTSNGVTFLFESLEGDTLGGAAGNGIAVVPSFPSFLGVTVTINPPVPAIGFTWVELDGPASGTFTGTLGNEQVFPSRLQPFFGAADIGNISSILLPAISGSSSAFSLRELTFVPPTGVPPGDADLDLLKTALVPNASHSQPIQFDLDLQNLGPDTAENVSVIDFLDPNLAFTSASGGGVFDSVANIVTWMPGDLPVSGNLLFSLNGTTPPDSGAFHCGGRITNIAVANSPTPGLDLTNNLSVDSTVFGLASIPTGETCGNGIDDNCDGRTDCADPGCFFACRPTLPVGPGGDPNCLGGIIEGPFGQVLILPETCAPQNNNANNHACQVPRGACGGVTVPAFCCDPGTLCDPSLDNLMQLQACNLGVSGCVPRDPNFKESDPPVNIGGYGYTEAGRTMTYTVHYENVGNADAINVSIVDVLDENLDDTTLVLNNGGTYDPTNRTIVWSDPLLPPATPRTVSFQVDIRSDATPGTRVRNVATIIFPNAVPPSRVDTNFVEHVVPDPNFPVAPDLSVIRCTETSPGSGEWTVGLMNNGLGFAYNVKATILNPPASVQVTDGMATFAHPNDLNPSVLASVIPSATTTSTDTVRFTTQTPGDPCAALTWRIERENLREEVFTQDVQAEPDRDRDAVADRQDNCPDNFNPTQVNADGDGGGDACDQCPVDPTRTTPSPEICGNGIDEDCNGQDLVCPSTGTVCDVDRDGDIDRNDTNAIFAARNTPSVSGDVRDANGDGQITVTDSRLCVLRCTKPQCAP